MKIGYYLNGERKKNLYCRISDGVKRTSFSMDYSVDPKDWDAEKEEIDDENEYYFTLINFKKYLTRKYYELQIESKDDILERLKNEAFSFMKNAGLDGVAKNMFDIFNKEKKLPKYEEFVQAFEKFSKLKKGKYIVEIIGSLIHFHVAKDVFEMDTYSGLTSRLESYIAKRSYDNIIIDTRENIWSKIYFGTEIDKSDFLPIMLYEWNIYWNKKYEDVRQKTGTTVHLDNEKQSSWRAFQVYMECYDNADNSIRLAFKTDEHILYPLSVITMLQIFDKETCYDEYCEYEFYENLAWKSITINDNADDDDDNSMFFVRKYEI
jgi:hypothetical protein